MIMLGDLEGRMIGTLQVGRLEDINVDIFPFSSKTFGLGYAPIGKDILLIWGYRNRDVA